MTDARTITLALGGRWHSDNGTAPCPVCQMERRQDQNALALKEGQDGRLLIYCHKMGCEFGEILVAGGVVEGGFSLPSANEVQKRRDAMAREQRQKSDYAQRLWNEAQSIGKTRAETYLRARSITCELPNTLRYHSACWHSKSEQCLPAMLGWIEGRNGPAIHRTYLNSEGSGKAALAPNKAMLGPAKGGAIRLGSPAKILVAAEGIETALSLKSGMLSYEVDVWAALSAGGLASLVLPPNPAELIVATDGDETGIKNGRLLASRAVSLGWCVSLLTAPEGQDWNDVLRGISSS